MFISHATITFLVSAEPVYNFFNTSLNEDYFRLLMVIIVVIMVALLTERIEKARKLGNLNEELQEQAEKLEDANQELEAFAYSVSHDLRVPLRAIDGFSTILIEDYQDKLDDEGIRLLNIVRDNTAKMGHLIDDILLLSRAGRQEMKLNELDMRSLAENTYKDFQADTEGRELEFTVFDMPTVYADRALIGQVWQNLIGNAIKFTKKRNPGIIEVGAVDEGDDILFYCRDNGAGFDMKYINKLFGLFQRLHSPEEFEGTGVGLSIVQRIIKRHGGKVWGEGAVDQGAIIYFTLPKGKPKVND